MNRYQFPPWWHFWNPLSGFVGGAIAGLLLPAALIAGTAIAVDVLF